jgi:hypothetical protein
VFKRFFAIVQGGTTKQSAKGIEDGLAPILSVLLNLTFSTSAKTFVFLQFELANILNISPLSVAFFPQMGLTSC